MRWILSGRLVIVPCVERTGAGPNGQVELASMKFASESLLKIRLRSGLTWEEFGALVEFFRRCVHDWENGKAASPDHDHMIRRMPTAIRHIDRSNLGCTRGVILGIGEFILTC